MQSGPTPNCSTSQCRCTEHCMASDDVCTANIPHPDPTHHSLPDALAARPGATQLLVDGKRVAAGAQYTPGATHRFTVIPGANGNTTTAIAPSWFLIDTGVGALFAPAAAAAAGDVSSVKRGGAGLGQFAVDCNGTRASFSVPIGARADVLWTAPADGAAQTKAALRAVTLRVAEATGMGNLTVVSAVLDAPSAGLAPKGEVGFACVVGAGVRPSGGPPTRQCMTVPIGTVGALTKASCESACFAADGSSGGGVTDAYRCLRCDHVYNRSDDKLGRAFEDLPDDWVCPVCGAPKSAYAKQTLEDGAVMWSHA